MPKTSEQNPWVQNLFLAALYFGLGKLAFALSSSLGIVTNVAFFPEGVALAFAIARGPVVFWGIFAGQFALGFGAGPSVGALLAISVVNGLASLLGAEVYGRLGHKPTSRGPRALLAISLVSMLVAQPISASLGNLALLLGGGLAAADYLDSWLTWWMGNCVGQMVMAPLALLLLTAERGFLRLGGWLSYLGTLVFGSGVYWLADQVGAEFSFIALLLLFPFFILLAVYVSWPVLALSLMLNTLFAFGLTSWGHGPFAAATRLSSFVRLDMLLLGLQLTIPPLNALVGKVRHERGLARASEERYRLLAENISDGVAWLQGGQLRFASPSYLRMLGLPAQAQAPLPWERVLERVHPDDRPRLLDIWLRCPEGLDRRHECEYRVAAPGGGWVRMEDWARCDLDFSTGEQAVYINTRDIDGKKKMQESLRANQETLRLAMENGQVGFWQHDLERGKFRASPSWLRGLGYEEFVQDWESWTGLLVAEDLDAYAHQQMLLRSGQEEQVSTSFRVVSRQGALIWLIERAKVLEWGPDGKPSRLVGTLVNVSQLKSAEERLKRADRAKNRLLSIVSHDLRGPLGLMAQQARSLAQDPMGRDLAQGLAQAHELLENLLQWAKLDMDELPQVPSRFSLRQAVEQASRAVDAQAKARGLRLLNQVEPEALVLADFNGLQVVLRNLLANAIRFSPRGGQVSLASESRPPRGQVCWVSDQGPGLGLANPQDVFYAEAKPKSDSGLGLVMARKFVEKNGGSIWVESSGPQGTTFGFSLPGGQAEAAEADEVAEGGWAEVLAKMGRQPEMASAFGQELEALLGSTRELLSEDAISALAERLRRQGRANDCPSLERSALQIEEALKIFDLERINQEMRRLSVLAERLSPEPPIF